MSLFLKNVLWLDPPTLKLARGHLRVEQGPSGGVHLLSGAPEAEEIGANDEVMDCRGRLVTRAFGCGHHHIYSTLARGMPPPPAAPRDFRDILKLIWWRLDKLLDRDMIQASALAAAMHLAKQGVGFVIDHHSSPGHVEGSLSLIAEAFDRVGIGHVLCYECSGRDGRAARDAGLAETEAYLSKGRAAHVGLHASFTVDDALLAEAVAMAKRFDTGLHLHVAEDASDQEHCLAVHGKRVVTRLADAGALESPRTILAHCVHLDEDERALIRQSPVWVAQNAESNLNNGVGLGVYADFAPRVVLGTDGMHSDMIRAAQAAYLAAVGREELSPRGACERLRAVHGLGALFTDRFRGAGDGENNLVVFDYDSPTPVTDDNFPSHLIYGLSSRHVLSTVVAGRVVVRDRRLVTADEDEILHLAKTQAKRLWAGLSADAGSL